MALWFVYLFWIPKEGAQVITEEGYMCVSCTTFFSPYFCFFDILVFIFQRTFSSFILSVCFLRGQLPKLINASKFALWGIFSSFLNSFFIISQVQLLVSRFLFTYLVCSIATSVSISTINICFQNSKMRWLSQVQNYTSNIWPSTFDFRLIFVTIVIVVGTTIKS